jgi:hypothetical protein|tara:strand:- start:2090 stop:3079 length:990 start_codon:yes stop_codon:yes gene_type:complete
MKKFYFLLFALTANFLTAQTTADFTAADGYADGPLENNNDWHNDSSGFTVDITNEESSTSIDGAAAFWTEQLTSISGSMVSFEVNLNFSGDFQYGANTLMAQIGFYNQYHIAAGGAKRDFIYLSYNNFNGYLKISDRSNANFGIVTKAVDDWIGSDLTVKVSLTIGTSAADSYVSVILINNTTGVSTDVGSYGNGSGGFSAEGISVRPEIYAYANNGKVRGFFSSVTLQDGVATNTESMAVTGVALLDENSLNTESHARSTFNLSQNPIEDIVQLKGVEIGRKISIYSITGAKASNHIYDGSPLNISHLNTGVYFMQVPGFTTQKLIKK